MVVNTSYSFCPRWYENYYSKRNITVIEALKEVEKQSKLSVGYNDRIIDKPAINLNLKNVDLEKALSIILKGTGLLMELKEIILILFLNPKQELWLLKQVNRQGC